ncbi:helix-turn-helix domain-containing protein [Eggerthellaceae bacterium zg-893]|nr:helix-turn-helix domain-containing protein [Eggerthellaceae bacterium zg-893]
MGEKGRRNLRRARTDAGMTQQQVADRLGISLRYYQAIEAGERGGDFQLWDEMEDMFSTHQRVLRQSATAGSRSTR